MRVVAITAAIVLGMGSFALAQNTQFAFDLNGNLRAQTAEVGAPPQILRQPQSVVVIPGASASFSVVAANTRGLMYQWRFSGVTLVDETNDTLRVENVSAPDEGEFSVVLVNGSGSVTSAPAMLWIDSDADGMGDSFELSHFGTLNQTATADSDGDSVSNHQEFFDGTDPTDSNSALFRLSVVRDGGAVTKTPDRVSYTNGETVTLTAIAAPSFPFHAWTGDLVTRSTSITLVMTNNKSLFAHFGPITFVWTNSASGNWETAMNWTPNLVPGSNDNVLIARSVTVTLNTAAYCANVTLGSASSFPAPSSPTLTGTGTLIVSENLQWTAGTMGGSGRTVLEAGGTLVLDNPTPLTLNGRTLEIGGTTFWSGLASISLNNAVVTNRPEAAFHALNPNSITSVSGLSRFDNAGALYKPINSGALAIGTGVALNNQGTVTLAPGTTLRLSGGGSSRGMLDAPEGALVEWTAGTFTVNGGAQLNGPGLYRIALGTLAADTDLTVENLDLVGGTLGGVGNVTIANAINWTNGTMSGSGRTIIPAGVTLNAVIFSASLTSRTLQNRGTIVWSGTGNIGMQSAVITNHPGALFDVRGAGSLVSVGAASRFDNAGFFRKSANSGAMAVGAGISFNNAGSVEIQMGTLSLNGGGAQSGSFDVPAQTALTLAGAHTAAATSTIAGAGQFAVTGGTATLGGLINAGGTHTFSGGAATITGNYICTNALIISGGTANFDGTGTVAPALLTLSSGTLGGSNVVTVGTLMNWTGGTMSGSGRTIIPPGATLNANIPSVAILTGRTLENAGTAIWAGAGNIGLGSAVITNRVGALFNVQNAANLVAVAGIARFDNAGVFRKSGNPGTTTIGNSVNFMNFGTVEIRSGILAANGGYMSSANALLHCALGGTTPGTGHGQLQVAGAVNLNGSLSVDLINGFMPAVSNTFTVLAAGTRSGAFGNFFYPSDVVTMQLSNSPASVIVRVTGLVTNIVAPRLLASEIVGTDIRLTWTTISNTTYRLEFKSDLVGTNWNSRQGDISASSNTLSTLDLLTSSNRFYRVLVVQ